MGGGAGKKTTTRENDLSGSFIAISISFDKHDKVVVSGKQEPVCMYVWYDPSGPFIFIILFRSQSIVITCAMKLP